MSASFVFIFPNSGINTSQTRMFEKADISRCRLHCWLFSRSFHPSIHHLSINSSVAYLSMAHDRLPAYGATALSRPAQQRLHTVCSWITYLVFQMYFQLEMQPHSMECTCPVTLNLPRFRSFVLPIPLQKFETGVDDTEPMQIVWARHHRGSFLMMSAEEFIIHSFIQRQWRDLLLKTATQGDH